jgi:hypothetical protein
MNHSALIQQSAERIDPDASDIETDTTLSISEFEEDHHNDGNETDIPIATKNKVDDDTEEEDFIQIKRRKRSSFFDAGQET